MIRSPLVLIAMAGAAALAAIALPAGATAPGTNGKLGFERPDRTGADLFSAAADGSGEDRLTNTRGVSTELSYSPDGSKIAFARTRGGDAPFEIYSANEDGSGVRRLTRHKAFSTGPSWSPDGTKIVYATDKDGPAPKSDEGPFPPLQLYVMNADGTNKRRLVRTRFFTIDPTWSPNGARIALALLPPVARNQREFDSGIAVISADGGRPRRLTDKRGPDELNPNWSPDGASIIYERTSLFDRRQSDIAIMNADGSNERLITRTPVFETYPAWSPDGTRIAFAGNRDRPKSKQRLGRGFEIYTMAADGSDVRRITRNRVPDVFPDWQSLP